MPKRSSEIVSALIRARPRGEEAANAIAALADKIDQGSHDRAVALKAAAYYEDGLKMAITKHFTGGLTSKEISEVFDARDAPLNSLSQRIFMARALGILDERQAHDADIVRIIRNAFAHTVADISFDTPEIKTLIWRFRAYKEGGEMDFFGDMLASALGAKMLFALVVSTGYHNCVGYKPKPPARPGLAP